MSITAHKLTPGNWYFVEVVDKAGGGWVVISDDRYADFYARANKNGRLDITIGVDIEGAEVEVNIKNAENVALLNPSTYGVPVEWILGTGQGWEYVLYGMTLL